MIGLYRSLCLPGSKGPESLPAAGPKSTPVGTGLVDLVNIFTGREVRPNDPLFVA